MTDRVSVMTVYLRDLMVTKQAVLGLHSIYYGDQTKIPFTPTVCAEAGSKERALNGAPRRTMVTMRAYLLVYICKVTSTEATRLEADTLAEDIEDQVHAD